MFYLFYIFLFVPLVLCFIVFGTYKLWLLYLYKKGRKREIPSYSLDFYPFVTIQIPVYNEYNVIERIIKSATNLNYPKDRFEIQILDDSTDETKYLIDEIVEEKRKEGFNIEVIRREKRNGYKAGALKNGLKYAKGEFIAIFDADFIIPPDFLIKTLPFFKDKNVGLVQARWGFLNEKENKLAKIQSITLNTHFIIEHDSKFKNGYFFNFNGTAGIWRKEAIIDAGNWQCDTLAEDLDLSVRAYLKGWKFIFLSDLICFSELPSDFNSFATQQFRWTKGTTEVCLKLFKSIIKSNIKLDDKINILLHLSSPFLYVANFLLFLILWPLSHFSPLLFGILALFFGFANIYNMFTVDEIIHQNKPLKERISDMLYLIFIFSGFSIKGTIAVLEAIFKKKTPFERTPKKGNQKKKYLVRSKNYLELLNFVYWIFVVPLAIKLKCFGILPWLLLFATGSLYFFYASNLNLKN
ncbi:MAG: glycosyltransferase [candidate division WOR-3 bacterium]